MVKELLCLISSTVTTKWMAIVEDEVVDAVVLEELDLVDAELVEIIEIPRTVGGKEAVLTRTNNSRETVQIRRTRTGRMMRQRQVMPAQVRPQMGLPGTLRLLNPLLNRRRVDNAACIIWRLVLVLEG